MSHPYFSIIIPTYNRGNIIAKTIESVLLQQFEDFELIIVDDGSADNTNQVVGKMNDSRIRYFKKENEERGAARNFGAKKAKGSYISFLDSDDLFYENHLHIAANFIQEKNNPSIFFQQYEVISSEGTSSIPYQPKGEIINEALVKKGNFMSCHGVFVKLDVFLKNLFNEDRKLAGSEDYELWLRMAARFPIYYSPKLTNALIEHAGRSVLTMDTSKIVERKKRMLLYLFKDECFVKKYGHFKATLTSDANSYIALHQVLNKERVQALNYLIQSIYNYPLALFRRRTLVILFRLFRF